MNGTKIGLVVLLLLALLGLVFGAAQMAQAQPDLYEMTGSVGAGGTAVSGIYQTDVMIGQAAIARQTAGAYDLGSGFWGGGTVVWGVTVRFVYIPLIQR